MESIGKFVTWLSTNAGILSIVVTLLIAIVPAIWSFIRYLDFKNKELKHERFRIFHELIRDLVQPNTAGNGMYLDRQIAILYELRSFPEYYEVLDRMLKGLRENWSQHPSSARLVMELDLTLAYITKA
jgi:hypothetical protein